MSLPLAWMTVGFPATGASPSAGFSGRELRRVAESLGWTLRNVEGSHWVYQLPGAVRNLSIPASRELPEGTVRGLIAIMGLTVDEFLRLAKK